MTIADNLAGLGLELPPPPQPAANYVPWAVSRGLVYCAGQTPKIGNTLRYAGQVGRDLSVDDAKQAAELCALRLLSALRAAAGDLERVEQITKLTVFINAIPGFKEHPRVADGASNLIGAILGARGVHARSAVGVASLPGNAAVEIDMTARLIDAPEFGQGDVST